MSPMGNFERSGVGHFRPSSTHVSEERMHPPCRLVSSVPVIDALLYRSVARGSYSSHEFYEINPLEARALVALIPWPAFGEY